MRRFVIGTLLLFLAVLGYSQADEVPVSIKPLTAMKRWAIVIGASEYKTLGELRYAANDAKAFANALIEDFGFAESSVIQLIDEEGASPTSANVLAALDNALKSPLLNKGDLFVLYFSGHGIGTPKGDFLVPTDVPLERVEQESIPVKTVIGKFVAAGLKNVLVISDACRAGERNTFGKELEQLSKQANIGVMLGCQPGSRSYEWDRQRHGYFTHYLLQALKKTELRQEGTGALWASEIGKFVREEVQNATARTQDIPQVPAIECDERRDVMLGAFLPETLSEKAVQDLRAGRDGLDTAKMAAYLCDYASRLFEKDQYFDAAELFRVVDGLGALEDGDRFTLGMCLSMLGRDSEAKATLEKLEKSSNSYIRNASVLYNPHERDLSKKLVAAKAMLAEIPSTVVGVALLQQLGEAGEGKEKAEFLRDLLEKLKDLKPQAKAYLEGELAYELGDFETAEAKFNDSLRETGFQVDPTIVRIRLAILLISRMKFKEVEKVCSDGISAFPEEATWLVMRSRVRRTYLSDIEGAVEDAVAALKLSMTPTQLLSCIGSGGLALDGHVDRIIEVAAQAPRSWQAHIASLIATGMKEKAIPFVIPEDSPIYRYSENKEEVILGFEMAISGIWDDLLSLDALSPDQYRDLIVRRSGNLVNLARLNKNNSTLWFYASIRGIQSMRADQLMQMFHRFWGNEIKNGSLSPSMASNILITSFSTWDWETFDQIRKTANLIGTDIVNGQWLEALSLLIKGNEIELLERVPKLPEPSSDFLPMANGLRLYVEVLSKPKEAREELLKGHNPSDPSTRALVGLAWLKTGNLEKAEDFLVDSASTMNWAFLGLHCFALAELADALHKVGREEGNYPTFFLQFSHPHHKATKRVFYGPKPELSEFVGEWKAAGRQVDDHTEVIPIEGMWTIDSKGAVKGKIGGLEFVGTVDSKGSLEATASYQGKKWVIRGKLAPRKLYSSFELLQQENQTFSAIAEDGERLVFAVKVSL